MSGSPHRRARDLGIELGSLPRGPLNAITDVVGVRVGHATVTQDRVADGRPVAVRTGVTVIQPHAGNPWDEAVFAGSYALNAFGEVTGLAVIREAGVLRSPIALTNTHSLGTVRDELIRIEAACRPADDPLFALPVVAETWDGILNDINGQHVRPEHVEQALSSATGGRVAEGNVGGGTGMLCHGFKGGIGTASRVVATPAGTFTLGVLVQANHGTRERLEVAGVGVGAAIPDSEVPIPDIPGLIPPGSGSIIVVVATDAPLLPSQCDRVAQRASLGVARTGGLGEHWSGDFMVAFSTANPSVRAFKVPVPEPAAVEVTMLSDAHVSGLFQAAVEATEEAIVNALLAAETMVGQHGVVVHALDADRLQQILAG